MHLDHRGDWVASAVAPDDIFADASMLLALIGEQRSQESKFARRRRFHQSWYRAAVLRLSTYGATESRPPRPCGSILTDADAGLGLNFTSDAALRLYEQRRTEGWGVEPIRCTKYLTSSQALTLNLFGPLTDDLGWTARVLARVLERSDIIAVSRILIEFAPPRRSEFLNDMTRIDVAVVLQTETGPELLAVEVKYADRFSGRQVSMDRERYRKLAEETGLWIDPSATFALKPINQLVRCHALATGLSQAWLGPAPEPTLLVVHHADDTTSRSVVSSYRQHLTQTRLCREATLDEFVAALSLEARTPEQQFMADSLSVRYIAEEQSEPAWQHWQAISINTRRAT